MEPEREDDWRPVNRPSYAPALDCEGCDDESDDGIDTDRYLLDQTYGNEWWLLDE
jgi:hypothetical protein